MRSLRTSIVAAVLMLVASVAVSAQAGTFGDSESPRRSRTPVYDVQINSNIRGAEVYIDGRLQRGGTPVRVSLEEGLYTIRVEARGYEIYEERIRIRNDRTIYVNLIAPTAFIQLRVPDEYLNDTARDPWRLIDLYVDGRLRREARIEVEPGWHDIAIVSGGLKIEREFRFEAGRSYTIDLLLQADIGGRWEN
ncbi:MAG: PEGA domain-containing protein [Spirochaetales bacterium]